MAQDGLAQRVAPLFGLFCVAPRSQTHEGYAPSSRLATAQKSTQRDIPQYFNRLLGQKKVAEIESAASIDGILPGRELGFRNLVHRNLDVPDLGLIPVLLEV